MDLQGKEQIADHVKLVCEEYISRSFVRTANLHRPGDILDFVYKYALKTYWDAVIGSDMSEEEFVRHVATIEFISRTEA